MGLMKEVSAMKYKIGFHGYEEEKKEDLQPLEIGENKPVNRGVRLPTTTTALICMSATSYSSKESSRACRASSPRCRVPSKSSCPTTSA